MRQSKPIAVPADIITVRPALVATLRCDRMPSVGPIPDVPMDVVNDFRDSLEDSREVVAREIAQLNSAHDNQDAINGLFRALHNIKGNARMCMLDRLAQYGHHIENLIGEVRAGRLPYVPELGELVTQTLDELSCFVEIFITSRRLDESQIHAIETAVESVCVATPDMVAVQARAALEQITGKLPAAQTRPAAATAVQHPDLRFFRELAMRLCERIPHASGRIERTLPLVLQLNAAAPHPVNAEQLEAACYLHDLGLAFLPESVLCKEGQFSEEELRCVQRHPETGAQLLKRIPGWDDAAKMVAQHHIWTDGTAGYPQLGPAEEFHPGAQMLALVDAYESMTSPRPDRQFRRSVLVAVTEINTLAGRQFSAELAPIFITIVRNSMKTHAA